MTNKELLISKIKKYYKLDKYDSKIIENIATSDELTKKVIAQIDEIEKKYNYNISEQDMSEIIKLAGYHYDSMIQKQNASKYNYDDDILNNNKERILNAIEGYYELNEYDLKQIDRISDSDELTNTVLDNISDLKSKAKNINNGKADLYVSDNIKNFIRSAIYEPNDEITVTKVGVNDRKKKKKKVSLFKKVVKFIENRINASMNNENRGSLFQRISNFFVIKDKNEEISIPLYQTEGKKVKGIEEEIIENTTKENQNTLKNIQENQNIDRLHELNTKVSLLESKLMNKKEKLSKYKDKLLKKHGTLEKASREEIEKYSKMVTEVTNIEKYMDILTIKINAVRKLEAKKLQEISIIKKEENLLNLSEKVNELREKIGYEKSILKNFVKELVIKYNGTIDNVLAEEFNEYEEKLKEIKKLEKQLDIFETEYNLLKNDKEKELNKIFKI